MCRNVQVVVPKLSPGRILSITALNCIFGLKSHESRIKTLFRTSFVFYTFPGSDQKGLKIEI